VKGRGDVGRKRRARKIGNECHMGKAVIHLHHLEDCATVVWDTWRSESTTYSYLLLSEICFVFNLNVADYTFAILCDRFSIPPPPHTHL